MAGRENILSEIRKNRRQAFEMPDFSDICPVEYQDKVKVFMDTVSLVGGHARRLSPGEDVNLVLKEIYPDAEVIASSLPEIAASLDPDKVSHARELNGTGLGVVKGEVAVAENGCVWVPQTMKERAVMFISECLAIIVDSKDIVNNMHEAYGRIEMSGYGYGCFISGPSKTADIAQALVMGAQAARDVTVIIL